MTEHSLVIGAGVSGLSVALTLLQRGVRVTLLERGEAGAESSWAGGGIVSPLLPWDYAEPLSRLALLSMTAYSDWIAAIEAQSGMRAEYWRCGMQVREVAEPDAALAWCQAHGLAAQREPAQSDGTLWLPDIAQVRNPRLVAALREAVTRLGGVIHTHCAVESVSSQGRRMVAVHTLKGTYTADQFVLATGAWAGSALPNLPAMPNIRPIRGQMLLFKLEAGVLDTIVYRNGLYLIPRRDGHVLVGSTLEDVGFDKSTDDPTRLRLHAEAAELLPALADVQPVQHWAGLRPGSPDNIPIIDRHPDFENVFINAGHYRYGVTLAPASAELLIDLIEGNTPALDAEPYSWASALARSWEK
ncbi:MAG TPA: glycine oxidase ThiO [Thiobacillus sp.]|nr:MAG: glycine oxidase ThiO [Hydrogenophilales bacterium 28-61-11]OYZ59125.1 MAG: glycine oxidase ThiO [Hydrogenophilales bacterium 16-61-112]HQT31472.1 glycine oxidase ThiO [Thiobacillus sp.]HQT70618.1 glycine oxidase ThiO [Thiobacillus sp.]